MLIERKKVVFILILFLVSLILPFLNSKTYGKYIDEKTILVGTINIEKNKQKITLVSTENTNDDHPEYASKKHIITAKIKISEANVSEENVNWQDLQVKLDGVTTSKYTKEVKLLTKVEMESVYEIKLNNIEKDGLISLYFPQNMAIDELGVGNDLTELSLNIRIDNTAPIGRFSESSSTNNKSYGIINVNEIIESVSGWEISSNNTKLQKEFTNPVKYPITIEDYAENTSEVMIDIRNATNILIHYCSFDTYENKFIEKTCGQIAGDTTVLANSICKTELMLVGVTGIDSNELLGRAFVYDYWGDGTTARCTYSETDYNFGYNPSKTGWSVVSDRPLRLNENLALALGGIGMNQTGNKDKTSGRAIPSDVASQYLYGISGVAFKLKNQKDFSIVYQVLVKDYGWIRAKADGEECSYRHDSPISAIRINIVPISEKQKLIDYWNRDRNTSKV